MFTTELNKTNIFISTIYYLIIFTINHRPIV